MSASQSLHGRIKMDDGHCNLIYFDPRASADVVVDDTTFAQLGTNTTSSPTEHDGRVVTSEEIKQNIGALLSSFQEVHLCSNSVSCVSKIHELEGRKNPVPNVVLIYAPEGIELPSEHSHTDTHSSSGPTKTPETSPFDNVFGVPFLQQVKSRVGLRHMTCVLLLDPQQSEDKGQKRKNSYSQYFSFGAADVLHSPVSPERSSSLPAHAFRTLQERPSANTAQKMTPTRRHSWVGGEDGKPYAFLRESMVSGLMDRICNPGYIEKPIDPSELRILPERKSLISQTIASWSFSAHEFSDDELLYGAYLILGHVLKMPGLETWRLADDELMIFLMACRRVYNSFVIYHNFRHACDVLQAAFCFLLRIGAIPPFSPLHDGPQSRLGVPDSQYSALLRPFEAMTLVISCIGHDVGHPGVNNLFLVTLNAPLAQLYNDRSVLESFHCAAFSQILRRYWPVAFKDVALRKLMINCILATDMSHHTHYVDNLKKLREETQSSEQELVSLDDKILDGYRELLCCLLIKCADICNVARKYIVATEWADILTNEFANQATMETELSIPSCLFGGPPVLNDILKMGTSQIGFINIFAIPLFTGVSEALPGMRFTVDELQTNKGIWERAIEEEKQKAIKDTASTASKERAQSPHARRGSAFAQSQMRADPMVFGSHSASSLTHTRRGSATVANEAVISAARRASLGPTVIPLNKSSPGSRRGSAGVTRAEELPQQVRGASGIASAMGFDGEKISEPDSPLNANAAQNDLYKRFSSIQGLISNPPDFVSNDPASARLRGSNPEAESDETTSVSPSSTRGRGKDLFSPRSRESGANEQRPRSKSRRKLSLRFWRKSKSAEAFARGAEREEA